MIFFSGGNGIQLMMVVVGIVQLMMVVGKVQVMVVVGMGSSLI